MRKLIAVTKADGACQTNEGEPSRKDAACQIGNAVPTEKAVEPRDVGCQTGVRMNSSSGLLTGHIGFDTKFQTQ